MLDNLLIYKMILLNCCGLAITAWLWQRGFVADMFLNDASFMTYVALALFVVGMASCLIRAWKISHLLNAMKAGGKPVFNGVKIVEKAAHLDDIGNLIVTVGLTGTAIGVVMMLHSFNAGSLTDPAKVVETATMLGEGVGTAFRSTIVSALAWMWLLINVRMLKTTTIILIEDAR